jgi:hypothetical protein
MSGLTRVVLRLHLGCAYRYRHGGHYAPLFIAYHGRSASEFVAYVGLDGKDEGKHFVCELGDFDLRFTLVEETAPDAPAAEPVPERLPRKVAGMFTHGSGV